LTDQPVDPSTPPPSEPAVSAVPKKRGCLRTLLGAFAVLLAILAAALVSSLTIDLGPALKKRAETAGSDWLDRPMHMG
jgi:hypothetical protein